MLSNLLLYIHIIYYIDMDFTGIQTFVILEKFLTSLKNAHIAKLMKKIIQLN